MVFRLTEKTRNRSYVTEEEKRNLRIIVYASMAFANRSCQLVIAFIEVGRCLNARLIPSNQLLSFQFFFCRLLID